MTAKKGHDVNAGTVVPGTGTGSRPTDGTGKGEFGARPDVPSDAGSGGGSGAGGSSFPVGNPSSPELAAPEAPIAPEPAPVPIPATSAPAARMTAAKADSLSGDSEKAQAAKAAKAPASTKASDNLAPRVRADEVRRSGGGDEPGISVDELFDPSIPASQQPDPLFRSRRRAGRSDKTARTGSAKPAQTAKQATAKPAQPKKQSARGGKRSGDSFQTGFSDAMSTAKADMKKAKRAAKPAQPKTTHRAAASSSQEQAAKASAKQAGGQAKPPKASAPKPAAETSPQQQPGAPKSGFGGFPKGIGAEDVEDARMDYAAAREREFESGKPAGEPIPPEDVISPEDGSQEQDRAKKKTSKVKAFDPLGEDFLPNVTTSRGRVGKRMETDEEVFARLSKAADEYTRENRPDPQLPSGKRMEIDDDGNLVNPNKEDQDVSALAEIRRRFKKARIMTQMRLMRPWTVRFEGDHFEGSNKELKWKHAPEVQLAINTIQDLYKCTEASAIRLMQYAASLGVDNKSRICLEKADEFTISIKQAQALARQIVASQRLYGHPMGVVGEYFTIGSTKCYPCGYIDAHTLGELMRNEGGALYGRSIEDVRINMRRTWIDKTLPDLLRDAQANNRMDQKEQVFNFVRAAMDLDYGGAAMSGPLKMYGVDPYDNHRTFTEELDRQYIEAAKADPETEDIRSAVAAKADAERDAYKALEDNGGSKHRSGIVNFLMSLTGIERFLAILNPVILGSGFAEGIKSQGTTSVANLILRGINGKIRANGEPERFRRTDHLNEAFSTKEAIDTTVNLQMLLTVGGPDAVTAFAAGNTSNIERATKSDVIAFLDTYVRGKEKEAEDSGDKEKMFIAKDMLVKLSALTDAIMTGGGWLKELNAMKFLDGFLANMMATNAARNGEAVIDSAALESAIRRQGLTNTIMEMASTHQGRDALLSTNQLNMARRSPIASVVEMFFRQHGITEFVYATFVDKFLSYGIKFVELYFPFSSTINYLIAKGILIKAGPGSNGLSSLSPELGKYRRAFVGNTMGIDEARGLQKCIVYDLVQTGSTALIAGMVYALHVIFDGLDEDDDDDDKPDVVQQGHAEEYSFGGLFKVVPPWCSYDIMGWGYGLGTAIWAETKYGNGQFWNILINNTADAMSGSAVMDTINLVSNFWTQGSVLYDMAMNENAEIPEDWGKRSASSYAEEALQRVIKNFTPGFVNGFTNDSVLVGDKARERSAYTYYGDDTYKWTKQIDDYDEVLRRTWAKNNLAYAALLDLTRGSRQNEYNKTTGYLPWEMPVSTKSDPYAMYWYNKLEIDKYADADTKEAAAVDLLNVLSQFSSPADALNQGFILPKNARNNLKLYCLGHQMLAEEQYRKDYANADYSEWGPAYQDLKEYKAFLQNILDNWVFNEDVQSGMNRYEKLITDTQVNYMWKDSKKTANALDFFLNKDKVEKIYLPQGNAPSSLLPFTTIRKTGSYNDETALGWQNETTNLAAINAAIGDQVIPFGQDKGARIAPLVEGSQDYTNTDMNAERRVDLSAGGDAGKGTINRRSYVYVGEKLDETKASEEDLKEAAEQYGMDYDNFQKQRAEGYGDKDKDSDKGGYPYPYGGRPYGSRSYSYSGGGGSSYSPKIYSAPQRVYNTTARGLNIKAPYKATTTYLRPAFYTKGSREAYKRSDM